jgi:hypothetical protein
MNYKFHDEHGREIRIADMDSFRRFVEIGAIQDNTLLFNEETGLWQPASEQDIYHQISAPIQGQATVTEVSVPTYGRDSVDNTPIPDSLENKPGPHGTWLFILAVILLGICAAMILFAITDLSTAEGQTEYQMDQFLKGTTFTILIAYLVCRSLRKKSNELKFFIFAVGFLVQTSFNFLILQQEYQTQKASVDTLITGLKDLNTDKDLEAKDFSETKYGKFAPIIKVSYEYFQTVQGDFKNLCTEFDKLNFDTLLTEETLQDAAHIDEGQKRIQKMIEIVDSAEMLQRKRDDEVLLKMQDSGAPENVTRRFMTGFNNTREQRLAKLGEFFAIERAIAKKLDEVLNFVRKNRGKYYFVDEQLNFKSTRDADIYNRYLDELLELADRETQWQEERMKRSLEAIDKMQKQADK